MKIGFVLDDSLDKPDGVQQYVLTLGTWFSVQGHEVHYIAGETKRTDIANIHSFSRNVRTRFNQNNMSVPYRVNRTAVRRFIRQADFDVLHIQMPYSPLLAGQVIKAAPPGTTVVGTFHILPASALERRATRWLRIILKTTLARFDTFVSVSASAAAFAHDSLGIQSTVIPNAVNVQRFIVKQASKPDPKHPTIIFLGRLVERKGCLWLLKAIQRLHQHGALQGARVIIGGTGPLENVLRQYVHQHDLGSVVRFHGFVPEADKPAFLASADIAVFPSTGGESFGIVLVEAMAAGAGVVVGGNNPGYAEVLTHRADVLINPQDTPAFAERLQMLLTNPDQRKELHQWQQQLCRDYDVTAVGPQLLNLYSQAIAKRLANQDNKTI